MADVQTDAGAANPVPSVPTHPIAPRVAAGPKVPHIGPHIHAYRAAHQETVGHESDKWWAKVRRSRPDAFLGRIGAGCINTD